LGWAWPVYRTRTVEGAVELALDATANDAEPLAGERHFGRQAALFPTRANWLRHNITGAWRGDSTGLKQVVSVLIGRERVQF
jgi:hypothetical protein